jgi:hypothetical protein
MAQKRRFGTNKSGALSIYPPGEVARMVFGAWTEKARIESDTWASRYRKGVTEASTQREKVDEAIRKLASWYSALSLRRGEIARVYAEIKRDYLEAIGKALVPAAAPTPVKGTYPL